jgi:hypothetical protein
MTIKEQRQAALNKANRVRSERAEAKRKIAAGHLSLHDLLTDVPDYMTTAKVGEVLTWMPKVGRVKAQRMCRRAGVSTTLTLGRLSQRSLGLVREATSGRPSSSPDTTSTAVALTT